MPIVWTSVPVSSSVASPVSSAFVARQPIVDRERQLFGYELLCRPSLDATSCIAPYEQASARVLVTAVTDIGLQILTEGKPAFVNVTRALLLDGAPMALPPSSIVVELLETIDADPEVLAACARLREAGFQIALDDFALTDASVGLIPYADYIKVDVLASPAEERRRIVEQVGARHGIGAAHPLGGDQTHPSPPFGRHRVAVASRSRPWRSLASMMTSSG